MRFTAPWAESLVDGDGLSAVRARRRDWLTQDEVKKKPEQVRNEDCDQNPKNRLHRALPGVSIDISEAEQPGRYQTAEKYAGSETGYYREDRDTGVEVLSMLN